MIRPPLWQSYRDRGLLVLGFPSNEFGNQDPGSNDEIAGFCQRNYGVDFPMFAKVKVNGDDAHPLWKWLRVQAPGLLGSEAIKWNFTKFLIGRDGRVIKRYAPTDTPESIKPDIEAALAELRSLGAELVEIREFPRRGEMGRNELVVLLTELKADLNAYLAGTPAQVRTRTLADLIAFNTQNAADEMPLFGQEQFVQAEATKGLDAGQASPLPEGGL